MLTEIHTVFSLFTTLQEGFAKPGFLVKIKARGNLKPQHIEHM